MSGWGRIALLIGVGVSLGAGCGGRTGALDDEFGSGADGSGASASQGGKSSVAGKSGRAGTGTVAGSVSYGGTVNGFGGTAIYGGYGGYYPTGGAYPYAGYGGYYPTGGTYPIPVGGYGGYGYGGTFPVGGYYGGGFPVGGYGGFSSSGAGGVDDCLQCINNNCSFTFAKCLTDFGCISILSCMQSTGCQAFECYSDQYCRTTIDQWGGPTGPAMTNLLQIFSCAVQSGCDCN
jgi:hypothetical protein